jgi:hypothetical protein
MVLKSAEGEEHLAEVGLRLEAIIRDPVMQSSRVIQTFISQLADRPTS